MWTENNECQNTNTIQYNKAWPLHVKSLLMPVVYKLLQIKNNHSDNKMGKEYKNDKAIKLRCTCYKQYASV